MADGRADVSETESSRTRVRVRGVSVPIVDDRVGDGTFRLVHISDFHFRRWSRVARDAQAILLRLDYDALAVTGDFGTRHRRWRIAAQLTERFFAPLAEKGPIYAVLGNHDVPQMVASLKVPITFLNNEAVRLSHGPVTLELCGVDQSSPVAENLDAALRESGRADATILLAHYPSTVFRLPHDRVDLQLSGHTHGGQIRPPWLGCVWPNDDIPRSMAWGLHRVADTYLHVSAGLGVSPPLPFRINCPAEVTVLTLRRAATFPATQGHKNGITDVGMASAMPV